MKLGIKRKAQLSVTENGGDLDVFDTEGMLLCDVSDSGTRRAAGRDERLCYQRGVQSGAIVGGVSLPKGHRLGDLRLLWYPKGGHMLRHPDRQLSPSHAGTLIVIPPQACEGGELVVWRGRSVHRRVACDASKWTVVALPIGTQHEVTRVESEGGRSVLTAPIFASPGASSTSRRRPSRKWVRPRAPGVRD